MSIFMTCFVRFALIGLIAFIPAIACAQGPRRLRFEEANAVRGELTLEALGSGWQSTEIREGNRILARLELDPRGKILRYELVIEDEVTKARRGRVFLERSEVESAYLMREEGPLGSVRRTLIGPPCDLLLDPESPAILLAGMEKKSGFVHVLDVGQRRVRGPQGLEVIGNSERRLDLEGPVIRWIGSAEGRFERLELTASPERRLLPMDAAASAAPWPPSGTSERVLALRMPGEEEPRTARWLGPAEASGPVPVVLLLPSAGPRDVDGRGALGGPAWTREMAAALAEQGFASLRFEKRGIAARWSELIADARVAAESLTADLAQHDGQVFVLGHGEGALLATELLRDDTLPLRGGVLLAMPGKMIDEAMEAQVRADLERAGESSEGIERELVELRETFSALRDIDDIESLPPESRLLKDLLSVRPVERVTGLKRPFFLSYGDRDLRVPMAHRSILRTALALQAGVRYRFHMADGADHEFFVEELGGVRRLHPRMIAELAGYLRGIGPPPRER